jgi:hypothetical protein
MARLPILSFAFSLCCVIAFGAATLSANAQNKVAFVQPNPYAQQFVDTLKSSQDGTTSAGSQLGNVLSDALQVKQVARLSVILKCNHYEVIEVTYRDGSIKVVDDPRAPIGRNQPVDRDQLRTLAATLPGFTWGELECEE